MARAHGRIMSAIWNDEDFLALDAGPQRLYMFLLSQSDLTHAGLLPLRLRKWARKYNNGTVEEIEGDLKALADARFALFDVETEEVLIRTLVRNDGVYKQPKVMVRLRDDAAEIESPTLRSAFIEEVDKLPLYELAVGTRRQVEEVVEELRADFSIPYREGIGKGIGYPSDANQGEIAESAGQEGIRYPTERVSDTPRVGARAFPQPPPPAPDPQPPAPVPPTAGAAVATRDDAQLLIGEWISHCGERPPERVIGQIAKEAKAMLAEGISAERVRAGLADWHRKGLHPSSLPSVVHEVTTRTTGQSVSRRQSETNDLFDRAAQRAIAREANQ